MQNDKLAIRFDSVSFAYGNNENIFDNLSFDIHKGESVAIVGASGSGKNTIIKLLCKFYNEMYTLKRGAQLQTAFAGSVNSLIYSTDDGYIIPGAPAESIEDAHEIIKQLTENDEYLSTIEW